MYKEYDEGEAPAKMKQLATVIRNTDGYLIVSAEQP